MAAAAGQLSVPATPPSARRKRRLQVTERNRYRLTGAVFLVAVAAIVLPMLFDGEGVAPMHLDPLPRPSFEVDETIPPAPDVTPAIDARRELRAAIDEDGYAKDTGTRIGDPVLVAEDAADAELDLKWAVQVGSFARTENATGQRDRLLADGHAAFLSHVKRDGAPATRVAVGPFVDRDDAVRAKAALDSRYGFEAVVVQFSP